MVTVTSLLRMFTTPLSPSHYVELFSPLAATHALRARVEAVHDEAPGVRTLTLRPGRDWRGHRAGQHVRVTVPVDGRLATRTYTISSPTTRRDGCIAITVKRQGRASRVLVEDVVVGTFVTLSQADGDFVLPRGAPVRALFVTGGSGITPIASIVRSLAVVPDVVHVHYARTPADVIFGAELRTLAASHPSYRWIEVHTAGGRRPFHELVPDWRERTCWACGPAALLDDVTRAYADRPDALHVERFRAHVAPVPADAHGGVATFGSTRAPADGRTPLLRVAEEAGLSPRHGCRMGICHACDVTLVSGCARDLRTGTTISEPGARIQLCVCAAAGDVEVALQGGSR